MDRGRTTFVSLLRRLSAVTGVRGLWCGAGGGPEVARLLVRAVVQDLRPASFPTREPVEASIATATETSAT